MSKIIAILSASLLFVVYFAVRNTQDNKDCEPTTITDNGKTTAIWHCPNGSHYRLSEF